MTFLCESAFCQGFFGGRYIIPPRLSSVRRKSIVSAGTILASTIGYINKRVTEEAVSSITKGSHQLFECADICGNAIHVFPKSCEIPAYYSVYLQIVEVLKHVVRASRTHCTLRQRRKEGGLKCCYSTTNYFEISTYSHDL